MRLASFNVQNMRLRRRDGRSRLDGASDEGKDRASALDFADRRLTASIVHRANADILCMQEVFDRETLDYFLDHLVQATGAAPYPHRICVPGNDGHGRDIAVASRLPIAEWKSHAHLTPADLGLEPPRGIAGDRPVFRRDCLQLRIGALTLFACHFKAPWPDEQAAWPVRRLEAMAVAELIRRAFREPETASWLVLGDLNEPARTEAGESALLALTQDLAVDLSSRMPAQERWTHYDGDTGLHSSPDRFLVSPVLARRFPDARPFALRMGMSRAAGTGERLEDVGDRRPHASDHALMVLDLPGL